MLCSSYSWENVSLVSELRGKRSLVFEQGRSEDLLVCKLIWMGSR